MLKLETKLQLESLHSNQVQESAKLEYKASGAIENTDKCKQELAKDISAMANAEGGQFVYGMTEANHLPAGLDTGINPKPFDGLWFEQVIQQNVSPKIEDLKILPVPVGGGNYAMVVTVPQSSTVHQTKEGRYYRRRNFRNDVMQDYEIREAMHRSAAPSLYVDLFFPSAKKTAYLEFTIHPDVSNAIALVPCIGNHSTTPALYTLVSIGLESAINVTGLGDFQNAGESTDEAGDKRRWIVRKTMVPHDMPIFKELPRVLTQNNPLIAIPAPHVGQMSYGVRVEVQTPGFSLREDWTIQYHGGRSVTLHKISK
jgi:hypothetical protein